MKGRQQVLEEVVRGGPIHVTRVRMGYRVVGGARPARRGHHSVTPLVVVVDLREDNLTDASERWWWRDACLLLQPANTPAHILALLSLRQGPRVVTGLQG